MKTLPLTTGFDASLAAVDKASALADPHLRAAAPRRRAGVARVAVTVADAAALGVGLVVARRLALTVNPTLTHARGVLVGAPLLLALPLYLAVFARYRLYHARHVADRGQELTRLLHATAMGTVLVAVLASFLHRVLAWEWLVGAFGCGFAGVAAERELARLAFRAMRRRGHLLRRVAIVGVGEEAVATAQLLAGEPELGYRVVAFVGPDPILGISRSGVPILSSPVKIAEQLRMVGAQGVIMATTDVDPTTSNRLVRRLTDEGVHVELTSSLTDIDASRLSVRSLGRIPVLYVEAVSRGGWRALAKRSFDVFGATVIALLSLPFLPIVALAIKLDSAGPVLFRQERVGRRGERFAVFKLRTMVQDAERHRAQLQLLNEADGPLFKVRHDPRVTRVGRVLRNLSLDELPQIVNVLLGQMSLVGPRPALPSEVSEWSPELFERLKVRPGMTGMWQVNGRSDSSFSAYQRWDLYYVHNWSILHDVGVLIRTLPAVFLQRGAC
ncbi:MAG TPA: sugar transferase [Acidimicrobiales bacterium]